MRRCAAFSLLLCSCLFPSLGSLTAGDAGADASAEGSTKDGGSGPVTIAPCGSVSAATGNAQQTHVIWAVSSKRWWLFYIDDDTTHLKTKSSPDFVTWTDGASLLLPSPTGSDGRNFSVAYASVGGADVVHVSFGHPEPQQLSHTHTRATIQGTLITFGAPVSLGTVVPQSPEGPDGCVTLVATNGTVWDATGFVISQGTSSGRYNEDVFQSATPDTGGTWTSTFSQNTIEVVATTANAHALVEDTAPLAMWEAGDNDPYPSNVHWSAFDNGAWTAEASVFSSDAQQDANDWGVAVLRSGSGETHVVRARAAGGYDHVFGTQGPSTGAPPPALSRTAGAGVVLLTDPTHLAAFDLASDGSIQRSTWSGSQWSPWSAIAPARTRSLLSGYCPDLVTHPEAGGCALVWTETTNGGFAVAGMLVHTAP